jgi:hypothetical protein
LRFGHVGEALEEKGSDGLLPGEVNELLVGLDRVREARLREDEEDQHKHEGFAVMDRVGSMHGHVVRITATV